MINLKKIQLASNLVRVIGTTSFVFSYVFYITAKKIQAASAAAKTVAVAAFVSACILYAVAKKELNFTKI